MKRARRRRKIAGLRKPRHVGVAVGVDCDPNDVVRIAATKVGGVREHRIDYEWQAAVVFGHFEADARLISAHIAAFDLVPDAVGFLVDHRPVLPHVSGGRMQHELALGIDLEIVRARKAKCDLIWIGARRDDEVVLELPLLAVVNEVDARVDTAVAHLRERRDVRAPMRRIVADEVVGLARQLVDAAHGGRRSRADDAHSKRGCAIWITRLVEHEHCFLWREKQGVARTMGREANGFVRLGPILLELQRHVAIRRTD